MYTNELKLKYEKSSSSSSNSELLASNEDANKIGSYLLKVVDFYFSFEESIQSTKLKDKHRTFYIDWHTSNRFWFKQWTQIIL